MAAVKVFFFQKENDLDHIVPIIHRIAKDDQNCPLVILSINVFLNVRNDFRIKYLLDNYSNIKIYNLLEVVSPIFISLILKISSSWSNGMSFKRIAVYTISGMHKKYGIKVKHIISSIIIYTAYKTHFIYLLQKMYLSKFRIYKYFNEISPSIFVFDHGVSERLPGIGFILDYADIMKIPTVSFPHGISTFLNHNDKMFDQAKKDMLNSRINTQVFSSTRLLKELLSLGLAVEKTYCIGSSRYSKEWCDILYNILPCTYGKINSSADNLKVVFFDRSKPYGFEFDLVKNFIATLSNLEYVDFKYKPHTRNKKNFFVVDMINDASDIPSIELTKWSDVVISFYSSILIDAVILGKHIVIPLHYKSNKSLYELYDVCIGLDTDDAIYDILYHIYKEGSDKYDKEKQSEKFLQEVVYMGKEDVLGEYLSLINMIAI